MKLEAFATELGNLVREAPKDSFEEVLKTWQALATIQKTAEALERETRMSLFGAAVTTPKEGVNNVTLADGRICKFTHKLYRNVDQKAVPATQERLRQLGINDVDSYLKPKYDLSISNYKNATGDIRSALDAIVTTKPALPTLEIR